MTTSTLPASDKQMAFIARLSSERGQVAPDLLTKASASALISALLGSPAPRSASAGVTAAGMYRDAAGAIFRVQESKTGNLYAKALVQIGGERLTESNDVVRWEFEYAAGAVRSLSDAQRLTLADAKAFGIQYGVCCVCGLTLKDAKSVAAGIGPVCAKKM
jgi:hypothetical protein